MLILAAPLLLLVGIVAIHRPPPALSNPMELAAWSKCDPEEISRYVGTQVKYPEFPIKQDTWLPADIIMRRQWGDCKGRAVVARDTLLACDYRTARIATITTGVPGTIGYQRHAIVIFTDPKTGRRGYIDAEYVRRYEPTTPWADVVANEPRWWPKGWRLEADK